MAKCLACGKFIRGGIPCPQCDSRTHHECLGVPAGAPIPESWRCPECEMKAPKGRDPSTPVRAAQLQGEASVPPPPPTTAEVHSVTAREEALGLDDTALNITAEFTEMELQLNSRQGQDEVMEELGRMQDRFLAEFLNFKDELRAMRDDMREYRQEAVEFRASVAELTSRVGLLERRVEAVEQRQAAAAAADASSRPERGDADVVALERVVAELKIELNDRDQDALLADLEIGQLPEERGENVLHAVTVLAAKLGVTLEERDIVFAERVGTSQGAGIVGEGPRHRRVVVRLARRDLRDRLLQGARVRRTLSAGDAGRADVGPRIFVNERLSRHNRQLFHRAREECRRLQWRFAWTKRGRVYVRQADGKDAYPIRSVADLGRVFGQALV